MDRSRQGKSKTSKAGGSRNREQQNSSAQFNSQTPSLVDLMTQTIFDPYNPNNFQPQFQFQNQPQFHNQPQFQTQPPFPNQPFQFNIQNQYASQPTNQYRDLVSSEDEDEETVPVNQESEHSSSDPVPTKKNKGKKPEKMKAKHWTEEEEVALAQAYVSCSENREQQKRSSFWGAVLSHFAAQLGGTNRTTHQLNSKHKDMFPKINKFNSIFNRLLSAMRSGQSERDVLSEALAEYKDTNKTKQSFQHLRPWEAVRHHIKWAPVPPVEDDIRMQPSKRSKTSGSNNYTSSDAKYPDININLDDDEENPDWNEEEPLKEPERPRRKGKRQVSDDNPSLVKAVTDYTAHCKERSAMLDSERKSVLEYQKWSLITEQKKKDLEFLSQPIDERLPESVKRNIMKTRKEICEKWDWEE